MNRRAVAPGRPERKWRFRRSLAEDVEQMFDVWYASVVATHDFLAKADLDEICVLVRRDYLPNHIFTVAVDGDDRVMGFMGLGSNGDEIASLFIHPAARGVGLGRAFLAEAASSSTTLEVEVNAQNLQAVGFYEAMGFHVIASSPVDDYGRPYPLLRMRR
jgi:putative acetyltransferase